MNPIQTAHNVSKTKIADEPVRDAIPNQGAERPFRIQFESVTVFESPDSQRARPVSSKTFKADECLLHENPDNAIRICRTVSSPETELSLWGGCNRLRGQTYQ